MFHEDFGLDLSKNMQDSSEKTLKGIKASDNFLVFIVLNESSKIFQEIGKSLVSYEVMSTKVIYLH